jgi:hypothetical protein
VVTYLLVLEALRERMETTTVWIRRRDGVEISDIPDITRWNIELANQLFWRALLADGMPTLRGEYLAIVKKALTVVAPCPPLFLTLI